MPLLHKTEWKLNFGDVVFQQIGKQLTNTTFALNDWNPYTMKEYGREKSM